MAWHNNYQMWSIEDLREFPDAIEMDVNVVLPMPPLQSIKMSVVIDDGWDEKVKRMKNEYNSRK